MKRKIIRLGTATLVTSLPSKWTKRFNLKQGDEIDLTEVNNTLVLQTGKAIQLKKEVNIPLKDEDKKDVEMILMHSYRKGFQKIILTSVSTEIFEEIQRITTEFLLGFEVTHKEKDTCTIENLAEPTEQKYDDLIRRVFLIVKETYNSAIADFEGNLINLKHISDLRKQHDRFNMFCRRVLIREQEENIVFRWELLTFLMHIEHAIYYMYDYTTKNKVKITDDIIRLTKESRDYFDLYYDAYFKKDRELINRINHLRTKFHFGECLILIEKKKGKEAVVFSYLREIFRLIQIGTSPILGIILDK